jgi:ABC-2 type transport system ATP-binding protein
VEGVTQVAAQAGAQADTGVVTVLCEDSDLVLPGLFEAASHHGSHINSVNIQEPNLEAVFLHLTGKALRD